MNDIVICCPYFGEFPTYFDLTLKSMENNDFIDWLIITDNDISNYDFVNIKFISTTFEEVRLNVKSKLGTDINDVYKLCDYKPTYGVIFSDFISKYNFWGYTDIDLILGDLKLIFNREVLEKFDKIQLLGHISIYKNDENINSIFKKSEHYQGIGVCYKKILSSKYIHVFDEPFNDKNRGINGILEENGYKIYNDRDIYADIDVKYNNFHIHNHSYSKNAFFTYEDGHLFLNKNNSKEEYIYLHLQKRKYMKVNVSNLNKYYISPKGFFDSLNIKSDFYKIDIKLFWILKFRINRMIYNIKAKHNLEN